MPRNRSYVVRAEIGVEKRSFRGVDVFSIARKPKKICKIFHKRYGNAGFLLVNFAFFHLFCGRTVKIFVVTADAADHGKIGFKHRVRKIYANAEVLFFALYLVIIEKSLETGYYFVSLGNGILERSFFIFFRRFENIESV